MLHLASHEINVGDGALNTAIRDSLGRLSGRRIDFTLIDIVTPTPDLSAEELDAYDLVVIGGGGGISNGPRAARLGIAAPIAFEAYKRSRTPFVFVGLGHNVFEGDPYKHGGALSALLVAAQERGDPFSVRNDGSLARLKRDLGPIAETVHEIPDPGFFVEAPAKPPMETTGRPYALIQIAGDSLQRRVKISPVQRLMRRFNQTNDAPELTNAFTDFALALWRKHGLDIIVAPHIASDIDMSAIVLRKLYAAAGPAGTRRPFRLMGTPHPQYARDFFGAYAAADLVVGMRGHAVICGVGLRRPVIAVSTHPKVVGFMEDCALGPWSVPLGGDLAGELTRRADNLLAGGQAAYFAARDAAVKDFAATFDAFLTKALARL